MVNRGTRCSGIAGQEEASYCVLPGRTDIGIILLCDHAGNALPPGYGTLGLHPEQLKRHIAYDIGAAAITRALAAAFDVPAVLTRYSRLLIDPNRGRDDPTLIMRLSDGAVIPGNRRLDAAERDKRLSLFYEPYHRVVESIIERFLQAGVTPLLLSIHSFTESWKAFARPWHVGVLWGQDARLAKPLLEGFYAEGDLIVGENEPYAGLLVGDSLWQHGTQRGIPNAIVEIRQDLIRDVTGQRAWSRRMCRILGTIVQNAAIAAACAERTETCHAGDAAPAIPPRCTNKDGDGQMTKLDSDLTRELEAAAFRRLVEHFRTRTDVQNIDLMNLAGFCRNCLSNWYREAAAEKGIELTKEAAREIIYGMPYEVWQAQYQKEASADALAAFEKSKPR